MPRTLDYAHPTHRQPSEGLRRLAVFSLLLPILIVLPLYGEWLLATWSLGRMPRPSLDDPKDIIGSNWLHVITACAIWCAAPAALSALVINAIEIGINRTPAARGAARMIVVIASWVALIALFRWDPGAVLYWWFD